MHIADGVLTLEATAAVSAVSIYVLYKALKEIPEEKITLTAACSAMFFLASFIHIPLGVTQIHLLLVGVIGVLIGRSAFLAIAVALILQALLLGYGGMVSVGVNLFIMAAPAWIVYELYRCAWMQNLNQKIRFFLVGFLGAFFSTVLLTAILYFSKEEYEWAAYTIFSVNIITMFIEGIISMFLLLFIQKTYSNILKV
ncbi:cobalt transporter CbiM [Candidatus Marinarcus aquaticus]|uniref:Cobalamin biosynthesis protein n=1 Tax=Candidatus Marinarcus aquaticus TaxID=2044504 RepID=A0A4Q0XR85_9BACT|nr:cobalt transporter CbiM [Candidatus Marinarcus aquaticus]RXJ56198.1 cobalamin biosynthesis protein [Candidatus Marinarcus aquaticus]